MRFRMPSRALARVCWISLVATTFVVCSLGAPSGAMADCLTGGSSSGNPYTVPASGVSTVRVSLNGQAGMPWYAGPTSPGSNINTAGGLGSTLVADVPVTAGEVLQTGYLDGAPGGASPVVNEYLPAVSGGGPESGFVAPGGTGGFAEYVTGTVGGGCPEILAVAAGGGGAGATSGGGVGGNAEWGTTAATSGGDGGNNDAVDGAAGGGATSTGGGIGGAHGYSSNACYNGSDGQAGAFLGNGAGGVGTSPETTGGTTCNGGGGGGGGGAGYYYGGGGGSGFNDDPSGGGGGGESYVAPSATVVSQGTSDTTYADIEYGAWQAPTPELADTCQCWEYPGRGGATPAAPSIAPHLATTVTLSSSQNPVASSQGFTLTATVNTPGDGGTAAGGSVTLYANTYADGVVFAGAQPVVNGQATFTVAANVLIAGPWPIYAVYSGYTGSSEIDEPGESDILDQSVTRQLTLTPDDQQISYGQSDPTFTFSVSGEISGDSNFFTTQPTCGVSGAHTAPGSYSITCSGGVAKSPYALDESASGTLTIIKAEQTINFTSSAPALAIAGNGTYTPTASGGGSGNPVTFSIDPLTTNSACSIANGVVSLDNVGYCIIDANQAGNDNYDAATPVQQTFQVTNTSQSITITTTAPTSAQVGGTYDLGAYATSGNPVVLTVDSSSVGCSVYSTSYTLQRLGYVLDALIHFNGVGTCVLDANQSGGGEYPPAPQVQQTIAIGQSTAQSITFSAPSGVTYGDPDSSLGGTATSGLPVSYSSTTPSICTIVNGELHVVAAGSCTIDANQSGNGSYSAAPQVEQTFTIAKATASLAITSASLNQTYDGSPEPVTVTTTPSGLTGVSVTYNGSGTAPTDVGSYPVDASLTNPNYTASDATGLLAISQASQTISFAALANHTYGDADFVLSATASSGLSVAYGASGPCSILNATNVHIAGTGQCTITASQAGNNDYKAATSIQQQFTVSAAATTTHVSISAISPNPTPQFSDTVKLSATVSAKASANGNGTFAGTVSFQVNGKPATALTANVSNTSPTASVNITLDNTVIPNGAGSYNITATFTPSSGNYAGSSDTESQAIEPEGANASGTSDGSTQLSYGGDQAIGVGGTPNLVASLSQSLAPEAGDGGYVDFGKVPVYAQFTIYPAACGTSCPTTPTWQSPNIKIADRSDWGSNGTGYAQTSGPKTLPEGAYLVSVTLVANGYIVAEEADTTLDVQSSTGTFITGGGFVATDSTSNAPNRHGNFAIDIKPGNSSPQGSALYIFRMRMDVGASTATTIVPCTTLSVTCRDVDIIIRSNKVTNLISSATTTYPRTGFATGQANVQFVDATTGVHYTQLEFGAGTFRVDVLDNGTSGSDKYGFTTYRKDGTVFHQAYVPSTGAIAQTGTGAITNQVVIGGGNITVHPH